MTIKIISENDGTQLETERLNALKCRDCLHNKLIGWSDPQRVCEIVGFPVGEDSPACISVNPKPRTH